jgi:hypothetical protein
LRKLIEREFSLARHNGAICRRSRKYLHVKRRSLEYLHISRHMETRVYGPTNLNGSNRLSHSKPTSGPEEYWFYRMLNSEYIIAFHTRALNCHSELTLDFLLKRSPDSIPNLRLLPRKLRASFRRNYRASFALLSSILLPLSINLK